MAATKNPQARLLHIRDEIDGTAAALQGVSFDQYSASYTLRRAIERAVQIVSEAAKSLPAEMLSRHSQAPWTAIISIGNLLRHEYQYVDDRRMWDIATVHFPRLPPVVLSMLSEFGP